MLPPLIASLTLILLVATLVARIPLRWWWIRCFEFPRVQMAILALICALAGLILLDSGTWLSITWVSALITVGLQCRYILPWTRLWRVQVNKADKDAPKDQHITLLIANVLMSNRQADGLINMINQHQPDIILTLESDQWWQDQLDPQLDETWCYSAKVPLDNLYGMHLYSRLPLKNTSVKWLIQDDIPSIHTQVTLESGDHIRLYAVHPRPPAPAESEKSLWRDAELLWVGQEVHEKPLPTLVAGDLNDVAWSITTRLFCRVSGMLDPRRGRGMFSTFHAKNPLLRWPLDHIFVTNHFTLVNMQRLEAFGSDHFPIVATFCYCPERQDEQETPDANREEREEAKDTIQQGKTEKQET
ncbi:endonuclease/exonuclease/phosphatase family protein [Vreelandella populi]|uniref:Endonuclease/exonuclease/phosphatase family protein n=1 Tax=Vreelandella populi TaxID=2498858 RepID=A0A3S0WQC9_9GAMM|nr:endonuclease/exonuclease/phosphatase family protein [Halomonas populi]RUR40718.1 endonuclease/exonuclease/phosphatase family protein [Halomonas populi]RUR49225.1 endonuclease/exonuclease/phosphatase family protein [Halomonas populi]